MSMFDKIAGYKKEKEELQTLVNIFNNRKKYEQKGATLPKGIIFYGPAGTGKTLFSEVLAQECSLEKITISIADSSSEYNICRRIRRAFETASKKNAPTMIFFDELDKVLPNEDEEYFTDRSKTILAQLLTLIDGMEKVNSAVFVATCNNYYSLPESLTRAGRLDKKICLDYPDCEDRTAILDMYMKTSPTKFEMSAESIAKLTNGFSPAALKTLVNDCILVSDENNCVSESKIREKVVEIRDEDLPVERSEQSYTIDAVRNLGSFVVARSYSNSDYVLSVEDDTVCNGFLDSIINNADYDYDDYDDYDDDDDYDDYDAEDDDDDMFDSSYSICSKNDLMAAITALFGGVVAQELVFGKTYDNLLDNFNSVDNILLKMSACGMLGLELHFNNDNDYAYSEKMRERLEEEFLRIKQDCYAKAKACILKNESLLKKLVPILVSRKSIEKVECEQLIEELGGLIL